MKNKLGYIKAVALVGLVIFLMAFAERRNSGRMLAEVTVQFTNSENLYITEEAVDKLLIQNEVRAHSVAKEALDLSKVEAVLDEHDMIENAEVYISVDGKLGALITQRKPIARVVGSNSYYIDRNGRRMPLSQTHSARVPLVKGITEEHLQELFPLLDYITNDAFLKKQITGVQRTSEGAYEVSVREFDFVVSVGKISDIDRKFNNFKAFYQKAMKDKKLEAYSRVNLRFGNQVVSTKK